MTFQSALSPTILVPTGKILLSCSFAYLLVQSMKGLLPIEDAFARMAVALTAIIFFPTAAVLLAQLGDLLTEQIQRLGHPEDLKTVVLDALKQASQEPGPGGKPTALNIPSLLEQAWRTGVWGVMSAIVDGIFLMISFILECARSVFWELLLVLFPLGCGIAPLFPRVLTNLTIYALELSLWMPVLAIVDISTAAVARVYMTKSGSWGLHVVAVEVVAILLILAIPSLTHRFLSGAFSGDFDAGSGVIRTGKQALYSIKTFGVKG